MKINELNKEHKIIIGLVAALVLTFGIMQTNISMKKIEIKNLNAKVTELESEKEKLNSEEICEFNGENNTEIKTVSNAKAETETDIVSDTNNSSYIDIKNKFSSEGEKLNKTLDEELKGKVVNSIDVMNLSDITDNQISKNIERLDSEKFNISIEKKKMGKGFFYRINLII